MVRKHRHRRGVTLVELLDQLVPVEDTDIGLELAKIFTKSYKMDVRVKTKITRLERHADKVVCHLEGEKAGTVEASHVLIAVGRAPVTGGVAHTNHFVALARTCAVRKPT